MNGFEDWMDGLTEGQIALFTYRIQSLSEHLQTNQKDHSCRKALLPNSAVAVAASENTTSMLRPSPAVSTSS